MKKILTASISFCLLLSVFFVNTRTQTKAEEKENPASYQYTFTVGSTDFHGVVDGESVNGSLLYPITIDTEFGRAGYDVWFNCPNSLYPYFDYDAHAKTFAFRVYHAKNKLTIIYPAQTAYINDEEIFLGYHIEKYQKINENAEYCGEKVYRISTYLFPLRLVFEFTGHSVDWNPDTQEITVTYPAAEKTEE